MVRFRHHAEVAPAHRVGARAADIIEAATTAGRPLVVVHGAAVETAEILLELGQRGAAQLLPGGLADFVHAGGGVQAIHAAAARVARHAESPPALLVVHPVGHDNPTARSRFDCSFAQDPPFAAATSVCLFDGGHAAAGGLPVLLRHREVRSDGIRVDTGSPEGRLLLVDLLLEHLDSRVAVRRLAMSPATSDLDRPAVERFVARRLLALDHPAPGGPAGRSAGAGECAAGCSMCTAVTAADGDLDGLLAAAGRHLGTSLLLEDPNFQPMAWSPRDRPPPSLTELITPGRLSRLTGQLAPGVPTLVRLGTPAAGRRWVVRIGAAKPLGYLCAPHESTEAGLATSWLRHLCPPLTAQLAAQLRLRRLRGEARRALVTVLVRGELSRASAQLAVTGLVGPLGVRVAAMAAGSMPTTVAGPAAPAGADPESLARRLDDLGLPHGEYHGLTVALLDGAAAGAAGLVRELGPHRTTIGLGSTVTDPGEISASARQAAWTCRMAVSTRRPMLDFADIGVHRLLLPGAEGGDPEFEEPIRQVEGAQDELGFDTVGTLVGYLDSGGNYRRAARDLTIHVNTLRYRLRRIADIIQADLDDPEQRFRLLLAARLRAGRTALRESGAGPSLSHSPGHAR